MKIPKPSEVGVYISSEQDDPDPNNSMSFDKFGFVSEAEVLDYIKEHMKPNGCFMVYTYDKIYGVESIKPLIFGDKDDLQ